MPTSIPTRELHILEQIEANPEVTQADLAETLGVAVGTVNFAIQRLIKKGYVRVKQLQRRRLKYVLTPAGITLRTKLAMDSLHYGMRLYRDIRAQAKILLAEVKQRGAVRVAIIGEGDVAEIARLTALELGLEPSAPKQASFRVMAQGARLTLEEDPSR